MNFVGFTPIALSERGRAVARRVLRAWIRERRDHGTFESDTSNGPISEKRIAYDGYEIVMQDFNSRYSKCPVVESVQWDIKDGQVRLLYYTAAPNAEMRCERHLLGSKCHLSQLGPVPATPPLTEAEFRSAR